MVGLPSLRSVSPPYNSVSPPYKYNSLAHPTNHGAFTLLEVMIALLLMAAVLAATWNLLGVFRNQLEKNQQRAERSQLLRSLRQRLEDDLRSCVVDTVHTPPQPVLRDEPRASGSLDAATARQPDATGRTSPSGFDRGDRLFADATDGAGPDVTLEIVQEQWCLPVVGLRGNSRGLVLDVLQPLETPTALPESGTDDQQAAIPDVVRRVIYVFTPEDQALRQGRPAGLLRCEWTERELLVLRQAAGASDLLALLETLVPDWPVAENDPQAMPAEFELTEAVPRAARSPGSELELSGAEVGQRVDLVPEITAFRLRYYDGGGWQDRWDSQQQKSLPVAVELRFDAAEVTPQQRAAAEIDPVTGEPVPETSLSKLTEESDADLEEPMDPRQMSAQTQRQRPQGQRVVIFLRLPEGMSQSPAEPSPADEFDATAETEDTSP